jgi:DNA (cytosine-5)-methyltransferase 1
MKKTHSRSIKVGCLFAAIGGFCRAFQEVGAKVVWANELDPFATQTFRENFPAVRHLHKPIQTLSVRSDKLDAVQILTAGFPCQPFSAAGDKKGFKDERGLLFLHIIRLLKEFGDDRPELLLLENVQYFRNHDRGRTFRRVQTEIQNAGYWFSDKDARVLNTTEYTRIPQNRQRIFMVAMRSDRFQRHTFAFPEPSPARALRQVREFLDLKRKGDAALYFTKASQYLPLFVDAIREGGPDSMYQLRRSYVRQNMSGQCFTLMANMGDGGHNVPVIKDRWGIRKLSPRECARFQGYDDSWFKIPVGISRSQIYKQLGNSVTVPLVIRLAENCLAALRDGRARSGGPRRRRRPAVGRASV